VSNVLNEEKKQQVIALGRLGWSLRRIEDATGVRRETASSYLKEAGVALRPPRGRRVHPKPASPEMVTTDLGAEPGVATAPAPAPQPGRSPSASACEPYREVIELRLSHGRNAMAIWQELVDTCSFAAEYKSVNRFVRKLRGSQSPEACAVIATAPGEELQVDYGTGPMVRDPHSGKYRRTRLFVLTLGYSRKSVRLLVFRSSSQIWAELHEKACRRLGGCTRVVVLDNLREGVLAPDIYDPTLNPLYRDVPVLKCPRLAGFQVSTEVRPSIHPERLAGKSTLFSDGESHHGFPLQTHTADERAPFASSLR
jgi:transposase